MLGAIIGDMVGSMYEFHPCKTKTFDIYADHLFHPERQSFVKYNNNDIVRVGDYSSGDSFTEKTLMLDIVNAIRQHRASPQTPSRMAG